MTKIPDRWCLTQADHTHTVEITEVGFSRTVTWRLDDVELASVKNSDKHVVLNAGEHGAIGVRFSDLLGSTRRVTWHPPDSELGAQIAARTGLGGVDLTPTPGSKAAARQAWIRRHPHLHVVGRTGAAAVGVALPLLVLWLLSQIPISWPDWHLPSIPWPDLPLPHISIPWPHWDLPELPAWLRELREKAEYLKYVWPVALAFGLAQAEVRRRKRHGGPKR
ncbi:MAG: hypothetical protein JXA67_18885 [Micromonosporaceae bacterium]|nr:hypothetical protein [Micromonosporaceae bacterium]